MDNIGNKIVTLDTIIEVANYFEDKKDKYIKLLEADREKNKNIPFEKQRFEYNGKNPKVEYTIYFVDGKTLTETDYNWFVGMLNDKKFIKRIDIYQDIHYSTSTDNEYDRIYKNIDFKITFNAEEFEDIVRIGVNAENLEEDGNKVRNELSLIISKCDERYNKTIKNKNMRIQSFCLSIGFILAYILYLVLIINASKMPEILQVWIKNKNIIVFGQWGLAIILGNVIGYGIIKSIYGIILPKEKYEGYSSTSRKSIYKEDIKEYVEHSEIQLGRFWNSQEKRNLIEKIYNITWKIVLVQLVISIVLYLILK